MDDTRLATTIVQIALIASTVLVCVWTWRDIATDYVRAFRRHHPRHGRDGQDQGLLAALERIARTGSARRDPAPADGCWASVWSDRRRDVVRCNRPPADDADLCERHAAELAKARP